jgi:PAS fold
MAALRGIPKLLWQPVGPRLSVPSERPDRADSRLSALALVLLAVGVGALVTYCLTSSSDLEVLWAVIVLTCGLPVMASRFLNQRMRARRLERDVLACPTPFDPSGKAAADKSPAGLLMVSADMRVCFVNDTYLHATLQHPRDVLGWKLEEVLPAEGLENQAKALLNRPHSATSCWVTSLAGFRPLSITMTRVPPAGGEDRILVVVEDFHFPLRQAPRLEGYIC